MSLKIKDALQYAYSQVKEFVAENPEVQFAQTRVSEKENFELRMPLECTESGELKVPETSSAEAYIRRLDEETNKLLISKLCITFNIKNK